MTQEAANPTPEAKPVPPKVERSSATMPCRLCRHLRVLHKAEIITTGRKPTKMWICKECAPKELR